MKIIIDKEVFNDSIAKSLMSSVAYSLFKEYELCVVINHFDGGYYVTIHEFIDEHNLKPFIESEEFDVGLPIERAISIVLHTLMNKIWS